MSFDEPAVQVYCWREWKYIWVWKLSLAPYSYQSTEKQTPHSFTRQRAGSHKESDKVF